ncbi:efflux RND transporter periplasmic adaptor subunit [Brevibacillus fulvus]|uniref:Multidrug efflux pump subunit AcrA (Membrane-fusion protein) n=1 Tax=Brevibacillus fulvus TaxID=1125967 RepID=A0A939BSP2_9BACL|nr:efflux RND transporter periplasmic adaptor subunit [Brevibacillus fulvus]MBM7590673.1 multidrug efflux pump subunit AcrA (membrane-fusion protein) [Brevibacillus fulvus]
MKLKRLAFTAFIIASIIAAGCSSNQQGQAGRMGQGQNAVPVEVKKAATEDFSLNVSLSGRLEAKQQVDLTSKASGRIKQIFVKVGDSVKAGQPIAKLDDEEGLVDLQRAEASYTLAKARYQETKEGTRAEDIAKSENTLKELQSKYESAKRDYERNESLFKEGAITSAELEQARLALVSAQTSLENQQQQLKMDKEGPTENALQQAEAELKQSEADYALAKLNYQNLTVTSPIDGVIGALPVSVGDQVGTSTVVAQIINLAMMKVKTSATEGQVSLFHVGQSVDVAVSSVDLKTKGTIASVSPLADDTKSYPIEIEIPNPDLKAKAGMIATINVAANKRQALVVPREAVMSEGQQYYVYVVEDGKAKQVTVEAGESDGERMEILSGLKGGEDVVVAGQNTVMPNAPVTVVDPKAKSQQSEGNGKGNADGNGQTNQQQRSDRPEGSANQKG